MVDERFGSASNKPRTNKYMILDIEVLPEKFEDSDINEYLMDKNFPRKLHPMFSRIIIIGCKLPSKDIELIYPKDEVELLRRFWKILDEEKPNVIVTFNGYNFDIPFLQIRSNIKNVKPNYNINQTKWKMENSNHFDCMQLLSANQTFLNVALDISCRLLGISVPENRFYGEDVPKLYGRGDFEAIKEHCRQDIELTEQLYLRLLNE